MKGRIPKIRLDQYRRIVELRHFDGAGKTERARRFAVEFGVEVGTVYAAMYRGIKRYDIELAKEAKR